MQFKVCVNYIIVIEFLHFFSMQTLIIFYYILVVVYIFVSSSCICELLFPTPVCPMNFDSSSPLLSSLIRNVAFSVANSTKKISYFFHLPILPFVWLYKLVMASAYHLQWSILEIFPSEIFEKKKIIIFICF